MKTISPGLILTALLLLTSCGQKESSRGQPDILMIAIDDLNDWVGFLGGHPQAKTPNIDKIAAMGMTFSRAYCAAPVCNPSRAALLSGVSPHKSGVYGNSDSLQYSPVFKQLKTLPQYFSEHGYYTTGRGKLFHQMTGPLAYENHWDGWSRPKGDAMHQHSDRVNGTLANGMPYTTRFQYGLDWAPNDVPIEATRDYQTAKWAAEELLKASGKPKFIAAGLFRPHLPWYVPQKYFDMFPLEDMVVPEINEADLEDMDDLAIANSGGQDPDKDYLRIKAHGLQKAAVQAYLAAMKYADDCVGLLLDAIEKNPNKHNTIIILWGDHGWHLGEKLHYRKFTMWEEACRVPLSITVPGVTQPNSESARPVNLLDIYPTLTDLAQLPVNELNDGRSIKPLLEDPELVWPHASISFDRPGRATARTENWRYILYEDGSEQLYNHRVDSLEWNNLAGSDTYQEQLVIMRKLLPTRYEPQVAKTTDNRGPGQDDLVE